MEKEAADEIVPMLQALWLETIRPFSPPAPIAEAVFAALASQYGQNGRFYHNLNHIQQLFALLAELEKEMTVPEKTAVFLAIWFHDVIYDPQASDNEAQSAAFATQALQQLELPQPLISRVAALILATQAHNAPADDLACQLLLDIDLAILGASPSRYAAYAAAIRQEYAHVPNEAYRNGRSAILQTFLNRPTLYYTPPVRQRFEAQARKNIQVELEQLAHPPRQ